MAAGNSIAAITKKDTAAHTLIGKALFRTGRGAQLCRRR